MKTRKWIVDPKECLARMNIHDQATIWEGNEIQCICGMWTSTGHATEAAAKKAWEQHCHDMEES
jgi:hypothetical protein